MNNNNNMIGPILNAVVITILIVLGYMQVGRYLKDNASRDCMLAGYDQYTYAETNSQVRVPNKENYKWCMQEKGY